MQGALTLTMDHVTDTHSSRAEMEGGSSMKMGSGGGSLRMIGSNTGNFFLGAAWRVHVLVY